MKYPLLLAALIASNVTLADNFNGPYLGAYSGYSWSEDEGKGQFQTTGVKSNWAQTTNPRGIQYGLLAGYNWTFENNLLLGIEADYEGRADDTDRDYQAFNGQPDPSYHATTELTEAGSLRGRAGYLFNKQFLLYATAGYSAVRVERTWQDTLAQVKESHTRWQDGWVAGVGAEYLLNANISARLEYRYADYGTEMVPANLWGEEYKQRLTSQALQAGIAYQF
jgi:outer membrane immunogenic protein